MVGFSQNLGAFWNYLWITHVFFKHRSGISRCWTSHLEGERPTPTRERVATIHQHPSPDRTQGWPLWRKTPHQNKADIPIKTRPCRGLDGIPHRKEEGHSAKHPGDPLTVWCFFRNPGWFTTDVKKPVVFSWDELPTSSGDRRIFWTSNRIIGFFFKSLFLLRKLKRSQLWNCESWKIPGNPWKSLRWRYLTGSWFSTMFHF